jgi:hypothetical protein
MSRVLIGNKLVEICGKPARAGSGQGAWLGPGAAFGDAAASSLHALRACSACAGDYEDPDRTAWMPEAEGADEVEGLDDLAVSRGGDRVERS